MSDLEKDQIKNELKDLELRSTDVKGGSTLKPAEFDQARDALMNEYTVNTAVGDTTKSFDLLVISSTLGSR